MCCSEVSFTSLHSDSERSERSDGCSRIIRTQAGLGQDAYVGLCVAHIPLSGMTEPSRNTSQREKNEVLLLQVHLLVFGQPEKEGRFFTHLFLSHMLVLLILFESLFVFSLGVGSSHSTKLILCTFCRRWSTGRK